MATSKLTPLSKLFITILIVGGIGYGAHTVAKSGGLIITTGKPTVFEYEGCQYIKLSGDYVHKGNCSNPIHCHNKK